MKRKILTALLAVVIVLTVVAAVFADIPVRLIVELFTSIQPDHSARYYPEDSFAYVSFDAKPTVGNIGELMKFRDGFGESDVFKNFIDELFSGNSVDSEIEIEQLVPWIGFKHSAGITNNGAIAMIGVRDRDRAAVFMPVLIEEGLDADVSDFTFSSDDGVDTWVHTERRDRSALGLTDDWLVFATDERALFDVLERMSGGSERSLVDNPDFVEASAAMDESRFGSAYLNVKYSVDDVGEAVEGVVEWTGAIAKIFGEGSWAAASAAWIDDGMVFELVVPAGRDHGFDVPDLVDPGELVPLGTIGFVAASFDPDLDKWRAALGEQDLSNVLDPFGMEPEGVESLLEDYFYGFDFEGGDDSTLADLLDYGLLVVSELTRVDLENDVFDNLSGNAVVGVTNVEFTQTGSMFGSTPIEVFALLSHTADGGEGLVAAIDGFAGLLGFRADLKDVGAEADAKAFRFLDYTPAYVLHNGYLAIGSTSRAVEQAVQAQNGDFPSIDSDEEYRRAVEALPESRSLLIYAGLDDIFDQLASGAEGDDVEVYELLAANLGSVASATGSQGGYTRMTTVVTLFPE